MKLNGSKLDRIRNQLKTLGILEPLEMMAAIDPKFDRIYYQISAGPNTLQTGRTLEAAADQMIEAFNKEIAGNKDNNKTDHKPKVAESLDIDKEKMKRIRQMLKELGLSEEVKTWSYYDGGRGRRYHFMQASDATLCSGDSWDDVADQMIFILDIRIKMEMKERAIWQDKECGINSSSAETLQSIRDLASVILRQVNPEVTVERCEYVGGISIKISAAGEFVISSTFDEAAELMIKILQHKLEHIEMVELDIQVPEMIMQIKNTIDCIDEEKIADYIAGNWSNVALVTKMHGLQCAMDDLAYYCDEIQYLLKNE